MTRLLTFCLLLSGLSVLAADGGYDTQPEGPVITAIEASADGATVTANDEKGRFEVVFPLSDGRPEAAFSFPGTDINDRVGLALDIHNEGTEPVSVYADLNGDRWVRGYVTATPAETVTLYVFARRKKHSAEDLDRFPGMHGVPGGKMSLWAGIEEPITAKRVTVFVVVPKREVKIRVGNIRPFGSTRLPDRADLFPFIDRYGQHIWSSSCGG